MTTSTYDHQVYTSVLNEKLDTRYIIRLRTQTLALIPIGCAREVFHEELIFFTTGCTLNRIGDTFKKIFLTILTCLTLKWLENILIIAV